MTLQFKKILHPLWHYVNQSFGDPKTVWQPKRFWRSYHIQLLERCWQKESASPQNYQ